MVTATAALVQGRAEMKSYYYTNNIKREKRFDVYWDNEKEGKIFSAIYDVTTGEKCSEGYNTKEEIIEFLHYYDINI